MSQTVVSRFPILKSSLSQAIIAFFVGGSGMVLGEILLAYPMNVLMHTFVFTPGWAHLGMISRAWLWLPSVALMVISSSISAAIGASLVVLVMRWIGLKLKWPAMVKIVLISIVAYVLVRIIVFLTGTNSWQSVSIQIFTEYAAILAFGLPFALAWLWVNRPLDRLSRGA